MQLLRILTTALVLLAVASGLFILRAESPWSAPAEAKAVDNPYEPDEESLAAAEEAYAKKCLNCHGPTGKGDGQVAQRFGLNPADFATPGMLSSQTDGELFWKITKGRDPMPSFEGKLSEKDRWLLVDYIRRFEQESAE